MSIYRGIGFVKILLLMDIMAVEAYLKETEGRKLSWKKILESSDTIAYEKEGKTFKTRIEARMNDKKAWDVFKIYNLKNSMKGSLRNYCKGQVMQELSANNKEEALTIIKQLIKEEELSLEEIKKIRNEKEKALNIEMKREYKEDFLEKWIFSLDNFKHNNVVFVRYETEITMDIILDEMYIYMEEKIRKELIERLGIEDMGSSIMCNIYYYNKFKKKKEENEKNMILTKIEMQLNRDDHQED